MHSVNTGSAPHRVRPEEQSFADLAQRAPSSGGFFVDQQGSLIVWVRDVVDEPASRAAMAQQVSTRQLQLPKGLNTPVTIRHGQYTFAELAAWRDIIYDSVFFTQRGVVSLDLDEAVNRVAIGVTSADGPALRPQLTKHLAALGVDTAAVVFRTEEPARPSVGRMSAALPYSLTSRADTMMGGILIGIENTNKTWGAQSGMRPVIQQGMPAALEHAAAVMPTSTHSTIRSAPIVDSLRARNGLARRALRAALSSSTRCIRSSSLRT
jgi:hypothetical protein